MTSSRISLTKVSVWENTFLVPNRSAEPTKTILDTAMSLVGFIPKTVMDFDMIFSVVMGLGGIAGVAPGIGTCGLGERSLDGIVGMENEITCVVWLEGRVGL